MADPRSRSDDSLLQTGGTIPESDTPAFSLEAHKVPKIPVLVAAPHGGRAYPASSLEQMRDPEFCSLKLEDRLVDRLAEHVARQTGASLLVANAPRALLDLNRAKDDVDWDMIAGDPIEEPRYLQANHRSRSGLGLVPRRIPGFGEIWRKPLAIAELEARIDGIHRPYHAALGKELERIRDHWGAALLIDLHSMPPLKRRYGMDYTARFVLGDRFGASCDPSLTARSLRYLDAKRCPTSHNRPYSGGYVLDAHASTSRGIHAVQLEICRSLYLDGAMQLDAARAKPLIAMLAGLVRELGAGTARLADEGRLPQAAE
jgi:N-formylglutamate amidohydrolase